MLQRLKLWLRRCAAKLGGADALADAKILAAKALILQMQAKGAVGELREIEFKVFSQFGEDGILQYLIRETRLPPELRTFVEFGVESYEEANTRFLVLNDCWRGLVLDGSPLNIAHVRKSAISWRHDLTARSAFITAENVNELIGAAGFKGEIGLLSIDIDGNDYWVWERLEVVKPVIVVVEYNGVFGAKRALTVPYDPAFVRTRAHFSNLYWGCSLKALELLGRRKGYELVGSNGAGNNAFFVRKDRLGGLKPVSAEQAYVPACFRESRDAGGALTYLAGPARLEPIKDLKVTDLERGATVRLGDLDL